MPSDGARATVRGQGGAADGPQASQRCAVCQAFAATRSGSPARRCLWPSACGLSHCRQPPGPPPLQAAQLQADAAGGRGHPQRGAGQRRPDVQDEKGGRGLWLGVETAHAGADARQCGIAHMHREPHVHGALYQCPPRRRPHPPSQVDTQRGVRPLVLLPSAAGAKLTAKVENDVHCERGRGASDGGRRGGGLQLQVHPRHRPGGAKLAPKVSI